MASSLLFRIKSVFDSAGIKDAKQGFTSVFGVISQLTAGIAKFALTWKFLGASLAVNTVVIGLQLIGETIRQIAQSVPQAAAAESVFVRLRTQMELLGKGSKENLEAVTKFAEQTAQKTRFSSEETQAAITVALRKTNDINKAIKQTSVLQDVASATGQDLINTTLRYNLALSGHSRLLRQITNLSEKEIQSAVRRGDLLDILAKKFGGSASKAAATFATKIAILANTMRQFREELGQVGLPVAKFIKDIQILGAQSLLSAVQGLKNIGEVGPASFFSMGDAIRRVINDTKDLNKTLGTGKDFTFNLTREMELQAKSFGKSADERRQLARDFARADELVRIAEQHGTKALSTDQASFIQQFNFATQRIGELFESQAKETEAGAKKVFEQRQKYLQGDKKQTGIVGQIANLGELVTAADKAGLSVGQISTELQSVHGLSKMAADAIANVGTQLVPIFDTVDKSVEAVQNRLAQMENKSTLNTLKAVSAEIGEKITAELKPKLNVEVKFDLPPETIREAVRQAVLSGLPGLIASLGISARNAQKEAQARQGVA